MVEPPDLDSPFVDERERTTALASFLTTCLQLEEWREAARSPTVIPPERRSLIDGSLSVGDTPELKLQRWAILFEDEIDAVFESRDRVVHGLRLSDKELRGANWLARHLLDLIASPSAA